MTYAHEIRVETLAYVPKRSGVKCAGKHVVHHSWSREGMGSTRYHEAAYFARKPEALSHAAALRRTYGVTP